MAEETRESQQENQELMGSVLGNLASQVEEEAQASDEEEEIEILDLDAIKKRRSRILIKGQQYELNRQSDLDDEKITLLNNLNNQYDESETATERRALNVRLLKIMLTTAPPDEVLASLTDGETRYVKNFFYNGWRRDMENLIRTVKASDL